MSTVVIVLIVLLLIGAFGSYPAWPHAQGWGYAPFSSLIGILIVVLLLLLLTGNLHA